MLLLLIKKRTKSDHWWAKKDVSGVEDASEEERKNESKIVTILRDCDGNLLEHEMLASRRRNQIRE